MRKIQKGNPALRWTEWYRARRALKSEYWKINSERGSWCRTLTRREVASAEPESFTENILVCSTLWGCATDVGTAGKEGQEKGVRNAQGKSRCAWTQEPDWCVVQARDKGLVINPRPGSASAVTRRPWGSHGCSPGRWSSFWIEPGLSVCI